MMSTQEPSSPAAANFKIHSTPHPRSKNRSENIRHALAPPVLHQSQHQKGEKILAIIDNNGFVLAPLPVAPVNEADTVLPPEGLNALKRMARLTDLKIGGSYLNLDGGFDSGHNRTGIFNAGLIPNIKANPRIRKTPKRGRKRLFDAAIHSLRPCVERTFVWEDKFKRLLLRFEFIQRRHYGMKLMAYTPYQPETFLWCLKLAT